MYRTRCSLSLARNRLSRFVAIADGYVTLSRRAMQTDALPLHSGKHGTCRRAGWAGWAGLAAQSSVRAEPERALIGKPQHLRLETTCMFMSCQ